MWMINGKTFLIGLLGQPVNHSLSPVIHNAALNEMGLNWCYLAFPCESKDLGMISDPTLIAKNIDELFSQFPNEVEAYRGGKKKLQGFFIGQLMKKTSGKVDPKLANQILSKKLNAS